jgi:hypothetical protein
MANVTTLNSLENKYKNLPEFESVYDEYNNFNTAMNTYTNLSSIGDTDNTVTAKQKVNDKAELLKNIIDINLKKLIDAVISFIRAKNKLDTDEIINNLKNSLEELNTIKDNIDSTVKTTSLDQFDTLNQTADTYLSQIQNITSNLPSGGKSKRRSNKKR